MNEETSKLELMRLCDVSRETMDRLEVYSKLLEKWNPTINLVSKTTLKNKWHRHFLDSAQLWQHLPSCAKTLVDIGSGAGFAGLVLAIIALEKKPLLKFVLIESDSRKCAFMRNVSRETGIDINILTNRIENVEGLQADIVTARALATLSQLLTYSKDILKDGGTCLFLKGDTYVNEVYEAKKSWGFMLKERQSVTHQNGRILQLTGIKHAG